MHVKKDVPILIVADYRTMLRIIRAMLRRLGFTDVDEASDGATALEMLRRRRYGLVICDSNMPPMSGVDLLRTVRDDPDSAATPFIMVSADLGDAALEAAEMAGVDSCIVKPFSAETLASRLASVLGQA